MPECIGGGFDGWCFAEPKPRLLRERLGADKKAVHEFHELAQIFYESCLR